MIKKGDKVKDKHGDIGIVVNADDIHNIEVEFENNGFGLYCLDKNCKEYSPLSLIKE